MPSQRSDRYRERPPYVLEKTGRCAGCGRDPVALERVYGWNVYCYRCAACRPAMPLVPDLEPRAIDPAHITTRRFGSWETLHSHACLDYRAYCAQFGGQMASCVPGCPADADDDSCQRQGAPVCAARAQGMCLAFQATCPRSA